jgi:hypothetical protein
VTQDRESEDALLQGENTPIILTEAFNPRNTETITCGSQSTFVVLRGVLSREIISEEAESDLCVIISLNLHGLDDMCARKLERTENLYGKTDMNSRQ